MKQKISVVAAVVTLAIGTALLLPASAQGGLAQSVSAAIQVPTITVNQAIAELCLQVGTDPEQCHPVALNETVTGTTLAIALNYDVTPKASLPSIATSGPKPPECGGKIGVATSLAGASLASGSTVSVSAQQDANPPVGATAPNANGSTVPVVAKLCLLSA